MRIYYILNNFNLIYFNLIYYNLKFLKRSIFILYCDRATIEVNRVKKKGMIDTVSTEFISYSLFLITNWSYFIVGLFGASKTRHGSFATNVAAIFERSCRFKSCK